MRKPCFSGLLKFGICTQKLEVAFAGLDGNKLEQVWDITHHFYLRYFKCVVNSALDRTFFSLFNHFIKGMYLRVIYICILIFQSLAILYFICQNHGKVQQERQLVAILFFVHILFPLYMYSILHAFSKPLPEICGLPHLPNQNISRFPP